MSLFAFTVKIYIKKNNRDRERAPPHTHTYKQLQPNKNPKFNQQPNTLTLTQKTLPQEK